MGFCQISSILKCKATLILWTQFSRNFKLVIKGMCLMKYKGNEDRYNDIFCQMIVDLYESG